MLFNYLYHNIFIYITISVCFSLFMTIVFYKRNIDSSVSNNFLKPKVKNYFAYNVFFPISLTIVLIVIWYWVVFLPLDFGHRDEIALLTEILKPTMYAGRFFPLGHMEFNILSLQLAKGNLGILYFLPLVQLIVFVFLIDGLIKPAGILVRMYLIITSFFLAGIIPLVNLVIPERNLIIFFLAGMYFYKQYYIRRNLLSAMLSVLFFGIALYYKEPLFGLLIGFLFTIYFYKFFNKKHSSVPLKSKILILLESIDIGIVISIFFFLFGYFFYSYSNGSVGNNYTQVMTLAEVFHRLFLHKLTVAMLFSFILIIILSHILIPEDKFERVFAVSIAIGGVIYFFEIIFLGLNLKEGYYYSLASLSFAISSAILLKNIVLQKKYLLQYKNRRFGYLFILCLTCFFIGTVCFKMIDLNYRAVVRKKNYQNEYNFLRAELKVDQIKSIYYMPKTKKYNEYATAILMIFLHKANIDHEFIIYSESGCSIWNESYNNGYIKCVKKDFDKLDKYDILIIEDNEIIDLDENKYSLVKHISQFKSINNTIDSLTIAKQITN